MALYFAFGSNLSRRLLRDRCAGARPLERAHLSDHRLGFAGHSDAWGGGTATILLAPGEKLWGGLYEVDEECLHTLAAQEGSAYALSRTGCFKEDGTRAWAYLLVKVRDLGERAPSERYVETIRRGYRDWELDPAALERAVDKARASGVHS